MLEHKQDQRTEEEVLAEQAKWARMEEARRIGVLTREIANTFPDGGKAFLGKTWNRLEEYAAERADQKALRRMGR
jgi:hypothetical protein